jgi:hypothetical protein
MRHFAMTGIDTAIRDVANLLGRCHASDPALGANLRGHPFQRHDGNSASLFSNCRLIGIGDVHGDAAFQHLGQTGFETQPVAVLTTVCIVHTRS